MKLKMTFLGVLALFTASICFAQDACDECQQWCYTYGCSGPKLPLSTYNEQFDASSFVVCANHCMFVYCNQPCQPCSGGKYSPRCSRPGFFLQEEVGCDQSNQTCTSKKLYTDCEAS